MDIARDAFVDGAWHAGSKRFEVRDPYDNALVALAHEIDAHLARATARSEGDRARLARRAEQLGFVLRALDL